MSQPTANASPPPPDNANQHKHSMRETVAIAGAIVAAVVVALCVPFLPKAGTEPAIAVLALGGEIFLRLLKMVVLPLVITSVMSGILGMGDIRKLGRPGLRTVLYYLATTVLAVILGMVIVNAVRPGVGLDESIIREAEERGEAEIQQLEEKTGPDDGAPASRGMGYVLRKLVLMLFTDNLFRSMAEFDLLPLIVFSIFFAALLTTMGGTAEPINRLVLAANELLLKFVLLLMKAAPLGIFCLVAARFGQAQLDGNFAIVLRQIAWFVVAVLVGLGFHAFVTLPAILFLMTRRNPYRYMLDLGQAILTAFSTASSTATIPVTIECAEQNAGVARRSVDFVVPLGATINMDGTALYEACAAIFIAQAIGMDLPLVQQITIALTATLAAIGAAGIPQAGLYTMVIVLNAVGLPVALIGLVLPVDWFLDRFRTAVNVFGDAVGAAVVEKSFPE